MCVCIKLSRDCDQAWAFGLPFYFNLACYGWWCGGGRPGLLDGADWRTLPNGLIYGTQACQSMKKPPTNSFSQKKVANGQGTDWARSSRKCYRMVIKTANQVTEWKKYYNDC